MSPADTAAHIRLNLSVLARVEKKALVWMAGRLPRRINSDHLSVLGMAAMAAAGLSFAAYPWFPRGAAAGVVLSLVANWFGDSLDGTLARVRDQQRPRYGFYVDHLIDIAGSAMLIVGMATSELMHPLVSLGLLSAYLLVSAESYLATHAAGVFRMSFLGFGPTELRIVLAAGAIRAAVEPMAVVAGTSMRLFDVGGAVAIAGLLIAFAVSAAKNTVALYRAEPLPARNRASRAA